MVAVTITALLSTAVVAAFQVGLNSWRRGEDFWDRSQRYSAAVELLQKQVGSVTPMWPVSGLYLFENSGKPVDESAKDLPLFVGNAHEMAFVTNWPMPGSNGGGLQVVHYLLHNPEDFRPARTSSSGFSAGPGQGQDFCISSTPIFGREAFAKLVLATRAVTDSTFPLFQNVDDLAFRYWGEAEPSPEGTALRPPRWVPYEEWDVTKRHQLPEAISIVVRFSKVSPPARSPYLRDSLDLLLPVNVAKSE